MKDRFTKDWIIQNGIEVLEEYDGITLRGLHYRLVARGMANDIQHYKRVVSAMTDARWDGLVEFDAFLDREREMFGQTDAEATEPTESARKAFEQMQAWAVYRKNRWENQRTYLEVFIEKKALQGVFEPVCTEWNVALNACKGYPSLTMLHDAYERFRQWDGEKGLVILYFGDHDPSGDDIPRSVEENLARMGVLVELERIALTREQVEMWKLPPAPTKLTDTRAAGWDGLGQVELDAVEPDKIKELCREAIETYFDGALYEELLENEQEETRTFREIVRGKLESVGIF